MEPGTLVLTTERLIFLVAEQVAYQIRRADIARAPQRLTELWIFARGATVGVRFELGSACAGPVPWRWHLEPAEPTTTRGELDAKAGDPRVGAAESRREVLVEWRAMMAHTSVPAIDHFLDDLPPAPVHWESIAEIAFIADGEEDGPPWLLVVRISDGRWVYFQHRVDVTGDVSTTTIVARSLESLWWGALTEDDRDRVTAQMTRDQLDDELVRLDAILEAGGDYPRTHAERRMLARMGGALRSASPARGGST